MHGEEQFRNKVTLLSFIMAMFVVVRHSVNYEVYGLETGCLYSVQRFLRIFTDLMVPSFFMISGYLFFRNYSPSKLWSKWKSRILSLLIPYLLWNFVAYLYYQLIVMFPGVASSMNGNVPEFSFGNMVDSMIWGGRNVTWFIRYLMGFCIFAPFAWFVLRRRALGIIMLPLLIATGYALRISFLSYGAIYLFGAWVAINFCEVAKRTYPGWLRWSSAFVLFATIFAEMILVQDSGRGGELLYFRLLQICLIWIISDGLAIGAEIPFCCKIAFFVFVAHSMILESIEKMILVFLGKNIIGAWIDFLFTPLLTLIILETIAFILRRYMPQLWSFINGGRGGQLSK